MHAEALAPGVGGVGKGGCGIALDRAHGQHLVAAESLMQQHIAAGRGGAIGDRAQHLAIDRDGLQCVLRLLQGFGHHQRQRLADIAQLVVRDHRLFERLDLGQRLLAHRDARHQSIGLQRQHFGASEHRNHARHLACGAGIHTMQSGMRQLAAQHCRVQHLRLAQIAEKASLALQQSLIFDPAHRCANGGAASVEGAA